MDGSIFMTSIPDKKFQLYHLTVCFFLCVSNFVVHLEILLDIYITNIQILSIVQLIQYSYLYLPCPAPVRKMKTINLYL